MHAWIANYVNLISCTSMWKIISIAKAKIEINSSIKGNKLIIIIVHCQAKLELSLIIIIDTYNIYFHCIHLPMLTRWINYNILVGIGSWTSVRIASYLKRLGTKLQSIVIMC